MFILSAGALVNVAINYFLIPVLGIEGASVATLLGYCVSDVVCVLVLYKMKLMVLDTRFFIATVGMIAYFVVWRVLVNSNYILGSLIAVTFTVSCVSLYYRNIISLIRNHKK